MFRKKYFTIMGIANSFEIYFEYTLQRFRKKVEYSNLNTFYEMLFKTGYSIS